MHYDLFIVDHFWNATVGHSVEDLPIKNFTNSFIQFFMPYLEDHEIQHLLDALYRYLKRKGQRQRVTKKHLKKVVFRDCPGLIQSAVLGCVANDNANSDAVEQPE